MKVGSSVFLPRIQGDFKNKNFANAVQNYDYSAYEYSDLNIIHYQLTSDNSNPLQHEQINIHFYYETASQKKSTKHEERRQAAGRDDEGGGTEVKDYIKINCRFYIHFVILLFRKHSLKCIYF